MRGEYARLTQGEGMLTRYGGARDERFDIQRTYPGGEAHPQLGQPHALALRLALARLGGRVTRVSDDERVDIRAECAVGREGLVHGANDALDRRDERVIHHWGLLQASHAQFIEERRQPVHASDDGATSGGEFGGIEAGENGRDIPAGRCGRGGHMWVAPHHLGGGLALPARLSSDGYVVS